MTPVLQPNDRLPLDFCRRCVGRQAIERSIRALVIRTGRFARHRATSPENIRWAARTIDGLAALLDRNPGHGERR